LSFLAFLEILSYELKYMEKRINWFFDSTFNGEWNNSEWNPPSSHESDPEFERAKTNYYKLKRKMEGIIETIPDNLSQDITHFQASLWHYIAEIVKIELRKGGDVTIWDIANMLQLDLNGRRVHILHDGYVHTI
jgi:hypothetical protein